MRQRILAKSDESPFLGIGEGKRKRAKAEAAAKLIAARTAAEKELLAAKTAAAQSGYKTPEQIKAEAEKVLADTGTIEAQSSNTLYYILASVVVVVMVGLYFIKKRR